MDFYVAALIAALVSTGIVSIVALIKAKASPLQRRLQFLLALILVWELLLIGERLTADLIVIELLDVLHFGVRAAIGPVFLTMLQATRSPRHLSRWATISAWLITIGVIGLNIAPTRYLIVQEMSPAGPGHVSAIIGPLWPVAAAGIAAGFLFWLLELTVSFQGTAGRLRNQIRYLAVATGWLAAGLVVSFLAPAGVMDSSPVLGTLLILFNLTIAAAMVRQQLMDFEFMMKQGMIYTGIVLTLGAFYSIIIFAGQFWLGRYLDVHSWLFPVIAAALVAFGVRPLEHFIRNATDRTFFKKRTSYMGTLREAGEMMAHLTDPDRLLDLIARIMASRMRLKGTAVLFLDERRNRYFVAATGGTHTDMQDLEVSSRSALIQWMEKNAEQVILRETLRQKLFDENLSEIEVAQIEAVLSDFGRFRAEAAVPSARRGVLYGILLLGEKKSGDGYSAEDMDLLQTLASQGAVAVENSVLYGRTIKKSNQLQSLLQAGQQVTTGTELPPKLDAITRLIVDSLDFVTASSIRLWDGEDKSLDVRSTYGFEGGESDLPEHDTVISREAFRERRPVTAPVSNNRVKVMMAIPLIAERQVLGTLTIYSTDVVEFERDEITLVMSFANHAASALHLTQMLANLRATQERLIQSEKLATVGTMASGIAHEIKNPLAAIKTFSELLPKKFDDPHYRQTYKEVVTPEIDRIDKIVADLLSFAKPAAAKIQTYFIHDVMERAVRLMNIEFKRKLIVVERAYGELPALQGDPQRIMQVFMNLLINASHALPKTGGTITLRGDVVKNHVAITVADTGKGIPADQLGQIFTPFFSTKETGTGLGLAISLKIIEDHQGEITVESEVGKGTTFTIRLPLLLEMAPAESPAPIAAPSAESRQ